MSASQAGSGQEAGPGDWIAVDWGTSAMRTFLVGTGGTVRAAASPGPGMGSLAPGDYEAAFLEKIGPWLGEPDAGEDEAGPIDVLVCGMAGARQGWLEAPYAGVPARLEGLLARAVEPDLAERRIRVRIVPGLCRGGEPGANPNAPPGRPGEAARADVMRGEETQILGLLAHAEQTARTDRATWADMTVCLPGTHSKWAMLSGGVVTDFSTHLTGELYGVLAAHSVLRHSLGTDDGGKGGMPVAESTAFAEAVRAARQNGGAVLDRLFGVRATDLLGAEPDADARAATARGTLSGLLIGAEIARALARLDDAAPGVAAPIHLVGAGPLTERYRAALRVFGVESVVHDGAELAVAGLATMREAAAARGS